MNIVVRSEDTVAELIRQLSSRRDITVNIYYQVIGSIENSTVQGVNVAGAGSVRIPEEKQV